MQFFCQLFVEAFGTPSLAKMFFCINACLQKLIHTSHTAYHPFLYFLCYSTHSFFKHTSNPSTVVDLTKMQKIMKYEIHQGIHLQVDDSGKIIDAKFKTFGCGSAIASSSLATEWVKGKNLDEAATIKNSDIAKVSRMTLVKYSTVHIHHGKVDPYQTLNILRALENTYPGQPSLVIFLNKGKYFPTHCRRQFRNP